VLTSHAQTYIIRTNSRNVIFIPFNELRNSIDRFLLDTGADINIIKANALHRFILVYQDRKVKIQGITEEKQQTLGIAYLNSDNGTHEFHVVPKKFLLKKQGIIGSTFLRLENAKIDFEKQTVTI